ncbi:Protein of unknown function [Pyronema omphalodes CBS 100304]|uniref:Uncharacterized protein n=1 Tax=Pyronema omphalodes (strain CBS 100304) TaxID=1076935 RepID=U4KWI7_PYROM|nr:Protein of unknown function [Pyronema omphalodes CBS 100304]
MTTNSARPQALTPSSYHARKIQDLKDIHAEYHYFYRNVFQTNSVDWLTRGIWRSIENARSLRVRRIDEQMTFQATVAAIGQYEDMLQRCFSDTKLWQPESRCTWHKLKLPNPKGSTESSAAKNFKQRVVKFEETEYQNIVQNWKGVCDLCLTERLQRLRAARESSVD